MKGNDGRAEVTVFSWNICGERITDRAILARQVEFIGQHIEPPAVVMLQAVNCGETKTQEWDAGLEVLRQKLADIGLNHSVDTGDWARELQLSTVQPHQHIAHTRCQLTASSFPISRRSLSINTGLYEHRSRKDFATLFPEKILVARVDLAQCPELASEQSVEFWNVGITFGSGQWGEEKVNALETVAARLEYLTSKADHHFIVGGDFNGPRAERSATDIEPHGRSKPLYTGSSFYGEPHLFRTDDGNIEPMTFRQRWQEAERRVFGPQCDIGVRDAYWTAANSAKLPSSEDHSHVVHNANPSRKRLDHILVSDHVNVHRCAYLQEALEEGLSDHAPVVAEGTIG